MGTNRRYGDEIDRRMNRKVEESGLRPQFESLPLVVTQADIDKPVQPEAPIPVEAWVTVTAGKVKVQAEAVEWNKKAVRIVWNNADGSSNSCWVYLGAITRR
ncbi:hypothetical protein [Herbiconiux daphne]|uniref:Uncharacterized protein n=1 Tax=Herbiconiux daphne TaxID=2970914 RepID=A0ABT2H073_9MICO|nr:hypothetical protein [Herbiconiux daphne]MCS5732746.1 hypothetical protein [Herbiconiux daphne]